MVCLAAMSSTNRELSPHGLREQLLEHAKPLQTVWSLNGRDVEFVLGFDTWAARR